MDNPNIDWTCNWCNLPFPDVDYFIDREYNENGDLFNQTTNSPKTTNLHCLSQNADERGLQNANSPEIYCSDSHLLKRRKKDPRNVLIAHPNINSLQNKIEELKDFNKKLKRR